ncbi:MAG: hypothetical protein GF355_04115, partial [Candidatus Eisenbacteria bacterium]|nr:hypothetical protein [Candidatus Eisenbacteria bacterium]
MGRSQSRTRAAEASIHKGGERTPASKDRPRAGRRPSPADLKGLIFLSIAALAGRWLYLLHIRGNPTFLHPTADPLRYHNRALEILGGDLLGSGVFFHSSPLYPYFLAFNYALNGQSIFLTYLAQAFVDVAGVVLLWFLARRLLGRGTAWICAVMAAGYQAFIFFTGELLEITLVLTATTAALYLLVAAGDRSARRGPGDRGARQSPVDRAVHQDPIAPLLGAGLCLGLAALGKPNILATIPFLAAGWKVTTGLPWRRTIRPMIVFACGAAIMILPVTARNLLVGDDLV